MNKYFERWSKEKVEATCSDCGQVFTIGWVSFLRNKNEHNGDYVCRKCGIKRYHQTEDFKDTVEYIRKDSKLIIYKIKNKLRKKHIILLNIPVDKEGRFPRCNDESLNLKLKCTKCGFEWKGSMLQYSYGRSGCPVCNPPWRPKKYKTAEQLNEVLKDKNLRVDPSTFKDGPTIREKNHLKCLKCGHEWDDSAYYYLYRNKKCPKCKDKENE